MLTLGVLEKMLSTIEIVLYGLLAIPHLLIRERRRTLGDVALRPSHWVVCTGSASDPDPFERDLQGYSSTICPDGKDDVYMLPTAHIACRTARAGNPGSVGWRLSEAKNLGAWKSRDACMTCEKNAWALKDCERIDGRGA